ncbi:toll/interleukin-1 receptor domain-containing protein [Latilactobacillus curvatus]|uniref:toll/interleukin-1 receptor domain-containing protein n=1 Tax=Latilactobacillus curvatus TaxID=28038 RepID=UPI000FECE182|nr:toll/interleukin-1 receptor domain-containing protein [Latilactobacillus curvatus]MDG2979882.1 toll/interleukin-1 receptor domain-containing protein [Latilactobacillus curvatus]QAR34775.1 toll/interleukin-1 receptor domain-containing protein [Latilactobacillus curvatus]
MKRKIFISYAWESENSDDNKIKSFAQWLAVYLKKWDIDVLLDLYENHPGSKLDEFMSKGIDSSNFVICICTKTYIDKMRDPRTGVYNEITLLNEKSDSPFVIPIIERGEFNSLPDFFKGKFVSEFILSTPYSQENEKSMFELISTIRDETLSIKNVNTETRIDDYYKSVETFKFQGEIEKLMNFDTQTANKVTFQYLLNDGNFIIGVPPMNFTTSWSFAGSNDVHSYNKVQEMFYIYDFKEFNLVKSLKDIPMNRSTSIGWATTLKVGDGIMWINHMDYVAIGKILSVNADFDNNYQSTLTLEYKILNPIELSNDFIQDMDINN